MAAKGVLEPYKENDNSTLDKQYGGQAISLNEFPDITNIDSNRKY